MRSAGAVTHYELFGVEPGCTVDELRAAYRRLAFEHHPDVVGVADDTPTTDDGPGQRMARLNEAWRILSDPDLRRRYDAALTAARPSESVAVPTPQPSPATRLSRRRAWTIGVQGQIAKLSRLAGRSATQTLLIRQPRAPRASYERLVAILVEGLCEDTESRVRAARAAGAAPLDLAVGATLVGIRTLADRLRRDGQLALTDEVIMSAELLDRMWDVLAHELPVQLVAALGGNPRIARRLLDPTFPRAQSATGRPSSAAER